MMRVAGPTIVITAWAASASAASFAVGAALPLAVTALAPR